MLCEFVDNKCPACGRINATGRRLYARCRVPGLGDRLAAAIDWLAERWAPFANWLATYKKTCRCESRREWLNRLGRQAWPRFKRYWWLELVGTKPRVGAV